MKIVIRKIARRIARIPTIPGRAVRLWQREGTSGVREKILDKLFPNRPKFDDWEQYHAGLRPHVRRQFRRRLDQLENPPRLSIVMPVYNTPERWLREAIASVQNQLYPHWELCIVDDASPKKHVIKLLEDLSKADPRIRVQRRHQNGGISAASNDALAMVNGEYIVLMDHDDVMPEHALFRIAEVIRQDNPDFFYSDEALVTPDGDVIQFMFRPAFSLELLRSHPYIVHLVGFRRSLLENIKGFRPFLTVSQDYDLILRASEKAERISHIPEILYLWRQHDTSTGHDRKSQVMEISQDLLSEHLQRSGEAGSISTSFRFNFFQVKYPIKKSVKVAVIIPTKNCGHLVKQCLESFAKYRGKVDYEIVLINHQSDDQESINYFNSIRDRHTVLYYEGAFNFSAINNWGIEQIPLHFDESFTHYLFCNNDIEAIETGWLDRMVEYGQKEDVGIVGAKLLYPDGISIQHAGVCVGMHGMAEHFAKFMHDRLPNGEQEPGYVGALIASHELSSVTAACLLMRRDAFEAINGYDETLAVGFGDVDLCLRTRAAGYRVIFCPQATLIHHESYSRGKTFQGDPHPEDSAKFFKRWKSIIVAGDPYSNPNIAISSQEWEPKERLELPIKTRSRCYDLNTHQFIGPDAPFQAPD
ncbi:MAG: glycosyltransferase family 2 protein [Cyanophyceae cyanobacterium]